MSGLVLFILWGWELELSIPYADGDVGAVAE